MDKRKIIRVNRPENPCPHCNSSRVRSDGKCWYCIDCGKYWAKHPKKTPKGRVKGCSTWNKGLTKRTDIRVKNYGEKQSQIKRSNPEFILKAIENLPDRKFDIPKEQLEELYKTMTQKDIADYLKISQSNIALLFKKYDIKSRSNAFFHPHILSEEGRKVLQEKMIGNINWRFSHEYPNKEEQKLIRFFEK